MEAKMIEIKAAVAAFFALTGTQLDSVCAAIRAMKARSDKLSSIHAQIVALRDDAKLPTTKALYQAILDMFD